MINSTGANSGAGVPYPSGAPEFILVSCSVRVTLALVFSVLSGVLCVSFVLFCRQWSCLSSDLKVLSVIFEFLFLKES